MNQVQRIQGPSIAVYRSEDLLQATECVQRKWPHDASYALDGSPSTFKTVSDYYTSMLDRWRLPKEHRHLLDEDVLAFYNYSVEWL